MTVPGFIMDDALDEATVVGIIATVFATIALVGNLVVLYLAWRGRKGD